MSSTPTAQEYYQKRAKEGYGLQYPDGHVIRIYQHVLKELLGDDVTAPRMFDFGCWNGTHAKYFSDHGFLMSGADIISSAVEQAKEKLPDGDFQVIDDGSNLLELFQDKFDVVFTNQVLYFLKDDVLEKRLQEFNQMLKPGGYFIATMISRNCFYSDHVTGNKVDGLEEVVFSGPERLKGKTTNIRFIENAEHIKQVFSEFKCIQVGKYECNLDLEQSTEHFIFIGQKK